LAQYTLKLSFDLRQVTQSLSYEFVRGQDASGMDNNAYPMEDEGPLAGTFNFQQGDEIFVDVIATAPAGGNEREEVLNDFKVTNCTFVSVPARMTEFLSLFDQTSACAVVDANGWAPVRPIPPTAEDLAKKSCRYMISNSEPLPVETKNGQWQISGYLSVQLPPLGHVPVLDGVRNQLFYFDPEGSTGSGGGWN